MMYWIYDYPNWAIAVSFCAVFVAVTWSGIFTDARHVSFLDSSGKARE